MASTQGRDVRPGKRRNPYRLLEGVDKKARVRHPVPLQELVVKFTTSNCELILPLPRCHISFIVVRVVELDFSDGAVRHTMQNETIKFILFLGCNNGFI